MNMRKRQDLWMAAIAMAAAAAMGLGAQAGQTTPAAKQLAQTLIEQSGVEGGLVVHLGCGDGRLTAALRASDRYLVQGLATSDEDLRRARQHVQASKLYGPVSVVRLRGKRLPYADNLVNLLVAEDLHGVAMAEVMRVLVPGGVVCLKRQGRWQKTTRPWPEDIDQWSHFLHDADNNAVAHDRRIGPPRRLHWVAKPLWLRSHETDSGVSAMVTAGGRLFYILDEGIIGITDERLPDTWSLVARDAFNGVQLWKRPLPDWGWRQWKRELLEGKDWTRLRGQRGRIPVTLTRRLVSDGQRVYVTLGYRAPLSILDAATGRTLHTCAGTEGTDEILCGQGVVVLCRRDLSGGLNQRRGKESHDTIMAIDPETGSVLWSHQVGSVAPLCLALGQEQVVFGSGKELVALDLSSGKRLWATTAAGGRGTLVVAGDVVVLSGGLNVAAVTSSSGELLWSEKVPKERGASDQDLFVVDGRVWKGINGVARDLHTGQVVYEVPRTVALENLRSREHHHRCYRNKATDRYILSAKEGIELMDLAGQQHSRNNWLRGVCKLGIMPANGMIYVPPDQCFCEPGVKLLGFCAVESDGDVAPDSEPEQRLERGPAFGQIQSANTSGSAADWPTLRHDSGRSGAAQVSISLPVAQQWQVELGGRLSQPVVAEGKLFVAQIDQHRLWALEPASGKALWSFVAGGRIDSPPTIYQGRVLFGSADGWVYCLRAADGQLAWRFRAAPQVRWITAFDQLESAWPVHGSVLVQQGVVYASAGRNSHVDGGIWLYGLDPKTGRVLYQTCYAGPPEDLTQGPGHSFHMPGARNDVLVGDGQSIYLGQVQFDNQLRQQPTPYLTDLGDRKMGRHLFSTAGLLDDSWYNRTYWMYAARWPGFYLANQAPKAGQLLVYDEAKTYGVKVYTRRNCHSPMYFPGTDGYLLFADDNDNEPALLDANDPRKPVKWLPQSEFLSSRGVMPLTYRAVNYDKGVGYTRIRPPRWTAWVPVRIRAMVATADKLFIAGPPDVLDPKDPLAAFEGRLGAKLWAVSKEDGQKLAQWQLDVPPVFDTLIAAANRLYFATSDGRLHCWTSAAGRQ